VPQVSAVPYYESMLAPHLEDLRKYCFYLTKSKWDGEDLYQEALLKSMLYFLNKHPNQDLKSFLIRVARNLWIDGCRSLQRQRRISLRHFPLYYTDSDYAEVSSLIRWIGNQFPKRNIEMLLLSDYYGYTMQEVAEMRGTTVSAVKSILFRTRTRLRQLHAESVHGDSGRDAGELDVDGWTRAIMEERLPCL
jgi:RNA polymerase sigma-70 factor (ECF subfamily)